MAHVILVVPCYNEEHRLVPEAFLGFDLPGHRFEFCFANDGSTDGTQAVLEKMQVAAPPKVRIHALARNGGKAEAVRQGFEAAFAAGPDYVGFWDADLATPLEELSLFVEAIEADPRRQMVFGSRVQLMGRQIERRPARHYLGRLFATCVSVTLGLAVYDTQCGAKLFRVSPALREVFSEPFKTRWIFDVEIIARFLRLWRRGGGQVKAADSIYELPLRKWRDVAGSKLRLKDWIKAAQDLWVIRRTYV